MGSAPATGAADCALAVCSRPRPRDLATEISESTEHTERETLPKEFKASNESVTGEHQFPATPKGMVVARSLPETGRTIPFPNCSLKTDPWSLIPGFHAQVIREGAEDSARGGRAPQLAPRPFPLAPSQWLSPTPSSLCLAS